jgi:hypothetical protein
MDEGSSTEMRKSPQKRNEKKKKERRRRCVIPSERFGPGSTGIAGKRFLYHHQTQTHYANDDVH